MECCQRLPDVVSNYLAQRPYLCARLTAPLMHAALVASLTAVTLAIQLRTGDSVWLYVILPALILANWAQFLRHPSHVQVSDCVENAVSRYPRVPPDQCQLLRPSAQDVTERLVDPAPRYQVADTVHFCKRCAFQVPACSHHCPICLHCIRMRDHHCFFLGACVGQDNMVYFMAFCLYACLGCAVAAFCIGRNLHQHHLALDTLQGFVNFLPPVAVVTCALGQMSLLVLAQVVLVYLAVTTSLGTAMMLTYQLLMVVSGQVSHQWSASPRFTISPRAAAHFRRVFGRLGLLHLLLPLNRRPYPALEADLSAQLQQVKVL